MQYPFLSPDVIERYALDFAIAHNPENSIPVPIGEIVELQLGIEIVPVKGLLQLLEIDGFWSQDFTQLSIDEEQYMNRPTRSRFTLAHESGHLVMHKDFLKAHRITSTDQWKRIVLGDSSRRAPLETQANIFAGFLLMPTAELQVAVSEVKQQLAKNPILGGRALPTDRVLAPYIAKAIAKKFDVYEQAAEMRLLHM